MAAEEQELQTSALPEASAVFGMHSQQVEGRSLSPWADMVRECSQVGSFCCGLNCTLHKDESRAGNIGEW